MTMESLVFFEARRHAIIDLSSGAGCLVGRLAHSLICYVTHKSRTGLRQHINPPYFLYGHVRITKNSNAVVGIGVFLFSFIIKI